MNAGVRERNRYKDIIWLMPSIDLERVFDKLGIIIDGPTGNNELRCFCPDHFLFTGRKSSDPNWTINKKTGETFCFTEARGSNLVWTVCRLLKCEPDDAAKFLTGKESEDELSELKMAAIRVNASRLWKTREDETKKEPIKGLDSIARDIENRKMSAQAYDFFIHPPGKKYPTNIRRETVDRYNVFERTYGFYSGRVVIPYFMRKEIVGFCAIDLLGKDKWIEEHPSMPEKDYRKVRYPKNFNSTECLFGFDDVVKGSEFLIVVEGAREVMKLSQEGYKSVAILGSYLSLKHRMLLGELCPKKIILMFDGDDAGVAITTRVADAMKETFAGSSIQKCFLPRGRDPKTLNSEELEKLIKNKKNS